MPNFKDIVTTGNREYIEKNIDTINNALSDLPIKQRAVILSQIMEESGGDPMAKSKNGTYQGLLQWGADRYRIKYKDRDKELANQIAYLRSTINNTTDGISWTHGGKGSGYKSLKEAYGTFSNSEASFEDQFRAFSYGYVRPQGKEASYNNRQKVGYQVLDRLMQTENPAVSVPPLPTMSVSPPVEQPDALRVARPAAPYNVNVNKKAEGGYLNAPTPWNELPLSQKAAIMREAVSKGIYNLQDIRAAYSNDGHLFYTGGPLYIPSAAIRKKIVGWEGASMYKPAPDTGKVNRSFEAEAQDFNRVIPASIRAKLSQDQLDALYSYGYNVGMGRLKSRVLPVLTNYVNGKVGAEDVASSMWGSRDNDPKMRGLKRRRAYERNQFINGSSVGTQQSIGANALNADGSQFATEPIQIDESTMSFLRANNPTDYGTPVDYSTPAKAVVPSPVEEKQNGLGWFNLIQDWTSPQQASQPLATYQPPVKAASPYVVSAPTADNTMLDASWFADGGPIKGNYSDWKKAIAEHNGIHVDEDNTYDYEGYYNKYPAQAWAMLSDDPEAHFTDEFKTVNHPSFSNQSRYSGIVDARFNPEGIIGGNWSEDGKRYTLSEDQARHRWNIGNTMDYFGSAENNGVEGFYPDGRHWTTVEGDPWGGVLPAVTVTPKKKARGGYLFDDGGVKMHYYSKDTPVEYNGVKYPGARMIVDGKEQPVFTDGTGTIWGLKDNGTPYEIWFKHDLPEVVVTPTPRDSVKDYFTESNDATMVAREGVRPNPHLKDRSVKGAKEAALWREQHPNLAAWGTVAGALPLAVASAPLVVGAGDMAAGTALGQGVTRGLTGLVNMAQGSSWLPWAEWVTASGAAAHGANDIIHGKFTPETALEVAPLAGWAGGVARNLQPQSVRNWAYVSKAPVGYDGKKEALKNFAEGILSGRPADIENPWWYNGNTAKALQEYARGNHSVNLQGEELERYFLDEGRKALRARTDMWRMYNHIPQKYGTFTPSEMHPGAWTAEQDIKDLWFIPEQIEGMPQADFVNSVGGNIGVPEIRHLGWGRTTADQGKEWGLTTTSDWWDLHPFSRPKDRIIHKYIQPAFRKFIGKPLEYISGNEVKTPEFSFLKPLEEKVAKFEVGKLIGSDPVLVQYDIPWTRERQFVTDAEGSPTLLNTYTPGFKANDILPNSVLNWKDYYNISKNFE